MSLGETLRKLREESGHSLRDVENLAGISSGHLSMIEQDKVKEPTPRILHALAGVYGADYLQLMREAGYLPGSAQAPARAGLAFKGAEKLSDEQRNRIQRLIDLEILDSARQRRRGS